MTRCITGFIVVSPEHTDPGTTMMVALDAIRIINPDRNDEGYCSIIVDGRMLDIRESMEQVIALIRQAQADLRNEGRITDPNCASKMTMVGRMIAFQPLTKRGEVLLACWRNGIRTVNEGTEYCLKVACQTNETVKDVIGVIVEDGDNNGDLNFFSLILDLGQRCDQLGLSSKISPEAPAHELISEMLALIDGYKAAALGSSQH